MISDSVTELHRPMLVSSVFCGISCAVFVLGQGLWICFGYSLDMRRVFNAFFDLWRRLCWSDAAQLSGCSDLMTNYKLSDRYLELIHIFPEMIVWHLYLTTKLNVWTFFIYFFKSGTRLTATRSETRSNTQMIKNKADFNGTVWNVGKSYG